jgi:hypothetical protein
MELDIGLHIMDNGTLMLGQKVEEIKKFIFFLTQKDQILNFLSNTEDDDHLASMLTSKWRVPIILPALSSQFLSESWSKLVEHKSQKERVDDLKFHPDLPEKTQDVYINADQPFDVQMVSFLNSIASKLPATLDKLLEDDTTGDDYFEHFSYILHLLQCDYLTFDKNSKIFQKSSVASHDCIE